MKHSTHKRVKTAIAEMLRERYRIDAPFKGISYPDIHRRELHPFHASMELKQHHDIDINSVRVKELIFYAWAFAKVRKLNEAAFDYCVALHFLCDSVIPDAAHSKNKRTAIEDMFENVEINPDWKYHIQKPNTFHDMNMLIDDFLKDCPVTEINKNLIENKMEMLFQTCLKLAYFVFGR